MQTSIKEWNDTYRAYPPVCLHQLFEQQVVRTPNATAVVFADQQLTYQELNSQANQLATHLQQLGVGPEVSVGICMERSLELIVGLLGILKAGACYVPLDPTYPFERLDFMLKDAEAQVLVTETSIEQQLGFAKTNAHLEVVKMDSDWDKITTYGQENNSNKVKPENLAYTIYTSGSTGKPKGVQILHQSVVNLLNSLVRSPGISRQDTLLAVTTVSFDMSVVEIFLPLMVGAKLHIANSETVTSGNLLKQLIQETGATIVQATPASWYLLLAAGWEGNKNLKIFCGGEAMSPALADKLLEKGGELWNMYGPTEITVYATIHNVGAGRSNNTEGTTKGKVSAPIGRPIDNTQIFILEEDLQPTKIGEKGELYVGGSGLARSYRNLPVLTKEKFIPNPFGTGKLYKTGDVARFRQDGLIEYLGRIDHQVKINGFRVELGEIEAILDQHTKVHRNAVLFRTTGGGTHQRLVAYIVPTDIATNQKGGMEHSSFSSDTIPTSLEPTLRLFLKEQLPAYMLPTTYVFLEEMPLTANGKINRKLLPEPDKSRPELLTPLVLPKTAMEQQLASVWQELLQVDKVGIHDNFFELGGSSILLNQLQVDLNKQFSANLSTVKLFQYPTIHTLAKFLSPTEVVEKQVTDKRQADRIERRTARVALRERRKSHRR